MVDKSGSITLLLCENYFFKIEDGNYYRLTNMKSIIFNGKGLSTQRFRDVINIDPFDFVVENLQSSILFCPIVLDVDMKMYHVCNNPLCKKELNVPDVCTTALCGLYGGKLLVKKEKVDINVLLQLAETRKGVLQSLYLEIVERCIR